ncbi:Uncharacterised protein [Candidatus Ornithobacterium hominis]|uniref:Uncharacterized protein n=1 Tax=Candidatus Ornithobacterium hominis TaxID=2497989 RepID=A0A383U426_9FLAO|nr:bacteriocin [Candidatus Ornithobacterium hominis]MCT7904742.1 bacteriocin [Candidatus Ornithobacterium hominis]CAI9429866.1 Class IIb bacteriocin, lactobin A/cerein 7B family [Candidatus Ornithobacterium hominis]SZD73911.1 Uncharacterised protein [Candidatus Ornithobacterium hominis]
MKNLTEKEHIEVQGGVIPVIYAGYAIGAMLCSSTVAIGMAIKHNLKPMWK